MPEDYADGDDPPCDTRRPIPLQADGHRVAAYGELAPSRADQTH